MIRAFLLLLVLVNYFTSPNGQLSFSTNPITQAFGQFGQLVQAPIGKLVSAPRDYQFAYSGTRAVSPSVPMIPTPSPDSDEIVIILNQRQAGVINIDSSSASQPKNNQEPIVQEEPNNEEVESVEPTQNNELQTTTVIGTGLNSLLARDTLGKDGKIVARFSEEDLLIVLDGPVVVDDIEWWLVEGENGRGWSAEAWLEFD